MCWNALNVPAPGCRPCCGGCCCLPPHWTVDAPTSQIVTPPPWHDPIIDNVISPLAVLQYGGYTHLFHADRGEQSATTPILSLAGAEGPLGCQWEAYERATIDAAVAWALIVRHDPIVNRDRFVLCTGPEYRVVFEDDELGVTYATWAEFGVRDSDNFQCLRPNLMVHRDTVTVPIGGGPPKSFEHSYGIPGQNVMLRPYWP